MWGLQKHLRHFQIQFVVKYWCYLKKDGKLSAGEIAGCFEMTQATVSYHLSKLKQADLIFENKYKNYIYYEINTSVFEEVMLWLSQFGGFKDET